MELVLGLMASAQAAAVPSAPTDATTSTYGGSLVQVNWTNAGSDQTRVYSRTGTKGAWTLITTVAAGVAFSQTGQSVSSGYNYGVSAYSPTTGLESDVTPAVSGVTPGVPQSVELYTYQGGVKVGVQWTANAGFQTRAYRRSGGGAWSLRDTLAAGIGNWDSADTVGAGYTYGVSHYDSSTGLESDIVTGDPV